MKLRERKTTAVVVAALLHDVGHGPFSHAFEKITGEDHAVFEKVKGDNESLGGLILELHSKLPATGEIITFKNYVFHIVAADNKRIKQIKVIIK